MTCQWEVGHKGHLQKLELEGKESKKGMCNEGTESHFVQIYASNCSIVGFKEMSAAHKFPVQHTCRINAAGSPHISCPYHSTLTLQGGHLKITAVGPLAVVFFNYPFKFCSKLYYA
jgi:hypothetical protein